MRCRKGARFSRRLRLWTLQNISLHGRVRDVRTQQRCWQVRVAHTNVGTNIGENEHKIPAYHRDRSNILFTPAGARSFSRLLTSFRHLFPPWRPLCVRDVRRRREESERQEVPRPVYCAHFERRSNPQATPRGETCAGEVSLTTLMHFNIHR
jgi:hypothetical protein